MGWLYSSYFSISFSSAVRFHEDWALGVPLSSQFKDNISLIGACLYDHINWPVAQDQQQSSPGLSQLSACVRCSKGSPKLRFLA